MATIAQDALTAFLEARKTQNITVDLNYLIQRETLEIASEKEMEANRIESETSNQQQQAAQKIDLTSRLKQVGFAVDNSLSDWQKLYNFPEVYGANWNEQAIYQHSISTGVDYFLSQAVNSYIMKPYEVGRWYEKGDTFLYNNQLFKVVQPHTSAIEWNPETTPALYTKIVAEGVIAEWVQPAGSQDAYPLGAKVTHNGFTWESTVNANVWEPGVYGWVKI